jgi:hypothetical protein
VGTQDTRHSGCALCCAAPHTRVLSCEPAGHEKDDDLVSYVARALLYYKYQIDALDKDLIYEVPADEMLRLPDIRWKTA